MPDSKRETHRDTILQTLVGGATFTSQTLDEALTHAPRLVAADGGANHLLALGRMPDLVVGDLDSISAEARAAFADRINHISEQDSTDFAKALRTSPADLTLAVGFIGGRVDHFLACLTELVRSDARCILMGEEDCVCIAPPHLMLDLAPGTRLSLWPLGRVTGTSTGLQWPIDGLTFAPDSRTGTSNRTTGPVELTFDGPMALITPRFALTALIKTLDATPRGAANPAL